MMAVLPPTPGRDSPMSIEHIAPENQYHSQNASNPLQSAHNDRCSIATDGGGDGDGNVEMRPLDDRHPPSSACTLFLALSLLLFRFGYPIPVFEWANGRGCVYAYGTSAQVHQVHLLSCSVTP